MRAAGLETTAQAVVFILWFSSCGWRGHCQPLSCQPSSMGAVWVGLSCCYWPCRIRTCCRTGGCRHRGQCGVTGVAGRCRCIGLSGRPSPGAAMAMPGAADATWSAGATVADRHAGRSHRDRARLDGRAQCGRTTPCAAVPGHLATKGERRCTSAPMPSWWEKAPHVLVQGAGARNAPRAGKAVQMAYRGRRSRSFLFSGGIAP